MPATPSVKAFSAAVTAKVRLKIRCRFRLQRGLIEQVAAVEIELSCSMPSISAGIFAGGDAQAEPRLRDLGKAAGQGGDIDGDLALWIAVVGIDAGDSQRPASARRRHVDAVADARGSAAGPTAR